MKISKETYNRLLGNSITVKQNKYKNKKVIYNGIKFDSKKEEKRYIQLKQLEKLRIIKDLELQKTYELQPSFRVNDKTYRKITYKADFSYVTVKDNKIHIEDTKGFRTEVYRLKRKMFAYKYGIEIEEI